MVTTNKKPNEVFLNLFFITKNLLSDYLTVHKENPVVSNIKPCFKKTNAQNKYYNIYNIQSMITEIISCMLFQPSIKTTGLNLGKKRK